MRDAVRDMGGLYDGEFEGYRTRTDAELNDALTSGLIAVDANVLLNLYRFRLKTARDLIRVLTWFEDRLVVPHQAVSEFWRNRRTVTSTTARATKDAGDAIGAATGKIVSALESWSKLIGLDRPELDGWLDEVESFADTLRERLSEHQPASPAGDGRDVILGELATLLDGRVTSALPVAEWEAAVQEGRRRVENEIPPGFRDAVKESSADRPEGPAGDYLVWRQATTAAEAAGRDLIILTSEEKDDWWWKHREELLGPHPALALEFHRLTGRKLFLLRPIELLESAAALNVDVDPDSLEDASRQSRPVIEQDQPAPDGARWTAEALQALLDALEAEDSVHGEVILTAAREGGRVPREEVYAITGRDPGQMLRAFTRPTGRLTRRLQDEGLIPNGVAPILWAEYPDGVRASYFCVPPEIAEIVAEEVGQDTVDDLLDRRNG